MAHEKQPFHADLRRRLYDILEHGSVAGGAGRAVTRLIVFLIVVNLAAVILESVQTIEERYRTLFASIEMVSLAVFTIEYALRVWVAAEHGVHHEGEWTARWRYVASPAGLVDLLAVLPFWFAFAVPADLRVILVFRIVRFLKLARYSPGMRSLLEVLNAERRALASCFVVLIGMTLLSGAAMHLVERAAQPTKFGTIPDAMWWALVTLSTIGGDVAPQTPLGRVIGTVTIFFGLIMIALPVGIVATAFADQLRRRDFIITWGMVARVPLFAGLAAADIADIMRLMRAQTAEPGDAIVRRGEPAHSMYFLAAGEVEIELKDKRVRMQAGHFFGEVAVLRRARRSGTVTAITRASLLILDAQDLHTLMERDPRIAERIHATAHSRLGHGVVTPKGDIVTEELEDSEQ